MINVFMISKYNLILEGKKWDQKLLILHNSFINHIPYTIDYSFQNCPSQIVICMQV